MKTRCVTQFMIVALAVSILVAFSRTTFSQTVDPRPPLAYLDPGTGSMIVQVIIAAITGVLFAIKVFWGRITTFFSSLLGGGSKRDA